MCQAYAAEAAAISSGEDFQTKQGWKAHREGKTLEDMPLLSLSYYRKAWIHGFICRDEGLIPWCLERAWRDQEEKRTGKSNYTKPTVEQADKLA